MGLNNRQRQILEIARSNGTVVIEELARHFDVTPQTIRRDINQLCEDHLLERHHGGAGIPIAAENIGYEIRQVAFSEEKQAIGRMVARDIPDRASLFINIGTTTEAVAQALRVRKGLKVITNNLNVAGLLGSHGDFEVIVTGGVVRHSDLAVIGASAVDMISQFKVDYAVIGISGIDLDGTLLDFDYREVRVAQAIMRNARRTFLAADHTKIGRNALVRLGHVSQLSAIYTDLEPPPPLSAILEKADVRVRIAPPLAPDSTDDTVF